MLLHKDIYKRPLLEPEQIKPQVCLKGEIEIESVKKLEQRSKLFVQIPRHHRFPLAVNLENLLFI